MTEFNRPTPMQIRRIADDLFRRGSDTSGQLGIERVTQGIAQAVLTLSDKNSSLGQQLRQTLYEKSGLSEAMVEWGLATTLSNAPVPIKTA